MKDRVALVVVSLALAAAWSRPARAADARADEARRECLAGRYQRGIDLLAALYAETRDANYIYNQGRCFQQNNRAEEAISRFREYLRKASDLSPEEEADVRRQITECEQLRTEHERPRVPPTGAPVTAAPPVTLGARVPAPKTVEEPAAGRGLRIAGAVTLGAGLGALGFGVAMGVRAHGIEKEIETRFGQTGDYSRSTYDSGHRAWVMSWIGGAAGAALVGGGACLYYLGVRQRATRESSGFAAAPLLGPRLAGVRLRLSF
jgi:hypothetical protein